MSSVSRLCKRSSTEPPGAVAVSLFHSVFRSRTDAFNEFVCGGAMGKNRKKKKLHLGKLPEEFLESPPPPVSSGFVFLLCARLLLTALFASARDAQDGGSRVPDMQHAQ